MGHDIVFADLLDARAEVLRAVDKLRPLVEQYAKDNVIDFPKEGVTISDLVSTVGYWAAVRTAK